MPAGGGGTTEEGSSHSSHQQYLGDSSDGLPEGPLIEVDSQIPQGMSKDDIVNFGNYYRIHCEVRIFAPKR